jgi:hypothetical protein
LRHKKKLWFIAIIPGVAIAFLYAQTRIATRSIQFDLRKIGESIYEARTRSGKWPMQIADLTGTEYLNMPYRRALLEDGHYIIVWQQDLDLNPNANRDRILAYDDRSLLSRFGKVWVCRGDLRIERVDAGQVAAYPR